MRRSTDNGAVRDAGFTVAEIVVAAAILFFAAVAILGLIGSAQQAAIAAKEKAVLVNAVASQMESVRSLSWSDIGTPTGSPAGTFPASITTTVGPFTITVTPKISWVPTSVAGAGSAAKDVVMTGRASLTNNGSRPMTYTVENYISVYTTASPGG